MKEKMMALYMRTLENCKFYEEIGQKKDLHNEIGVLRGIAYCMEEAGVNALTLPDFTRYIEIQNNY